MRIFPFIDTYALEIWDWHLNKATRNFWRGFQCYLTLDQIKKLPEMMMAEILLVEDEGGLLGVISIHHEPYNVCKFGIMVNPENQKSGKGTEILKRIEEYCFGMKGTRLLMTEIHETQRDLGKSLTAKEYELCGTIPEYSLSFGDYVGIMIYVKSRDSWRQRWDS